MADRARAARVSESCPRLVLDHLSSGRSSFRAVSLAQIDPSSMGEKVYAPILEAFVIHFCASSVGDQVPAGVGSLPSALILPQTPVISKS